MTVQKALYGHTSEATAYEVADYPYGYKVRTKIRYWLERHPRNGYRFVSQTLNPKRGIWNAPKKSTYCVLAGAMFLDEQEHVQWSGLGGHSDAKAVKAFAESFPEADLTAIKQLALAKVKYLRGVIDGSLVWTVNGVPQLTSEAEKTAKQAELDFWLTVK